MQRNLDLLRQLLFDIERRGATSPIDALRSDARHDCQPQRIDERIRYHLRLLIDASLLKEAGQTSTGSPCVRLTHEGQEFIELARSDARWREAKAAVLAATGGMPLTVLKTLLTKWAWRGVVRNERRRAVDSRRPSRPRVHRPLDRPLDRYVEHVEHVEHVESEAWLDVYATDPDTIWDDDQARLALQRAAVRRGQYTEATWQPDLYGDVAAELADYPLTAPLPDHLI